jgi:hypothetical protein
VKDERKEWIDGRESLERRLEGGDEARTLEPPFIELMDHGERENKGVIG